MTLDSMTARSRRRQTDALQAAERCVAEKTRTQLAAEIGMSYDQYSRYVNGSAAFRFEQTEAFARAYGLDPDVLGRAILTGDTSALTPFDFRAELAAIYPDDPGTVDDWYRIGADAPERTQRDLVDQARRQRDLKAGAAASTPPVARCAKVRADYRLTGTGN